MAHLYKNGRKPRNALDEFRDGAMELLGHDEACICDLAANRNQDVRTALG